MIIKRYFILLLFSFVSSISLAQIVKYSNEFLTLGVGARALGMSGAHTATTNDVTAGYYNPAGLLGIKSNIQVGLMHSEYFAGIAKYDYAAVAARIDATSTAGVSFIRFGVDDIPDTTELIDADGNVNYDKIKSFSAADYGVLLSYARKAKIEGLRYGANAKIIHRRVGNFARAWGFGIDVAAQYNVKGFNFGLTAKDITTTFNAWSYNLSDKTKEVFTQTGNVIPENSTEITMPRIIFGAARKFNVYKDFTTLISTDLEWTFDGKRNTILRNNYNSLDPKLGLEFGYKDIVFLRAGVGNYQKETNLEGKTLRTVTPTIGVGIKIKNNLCIDYALTDVGNVSVSPYSNIFSLRININRKEDKSNSDPKTLTK